MRPSPAALLLVLLVLAVPAAAGADLPEIVARAGRSVVALEITPGDVRPAALHRFGAGWVIDPAGHVVTSAALLAGATAVQVRLEDGRLLDGRVLGSDAGFDVAVIEVAGARLPPFPLGRADLSRLGEPVSALTRDGAGRLAVRSGILSARGGGGRAILDDDLHPDAALDATFVGGPLLDGAGRALGLLTAPAGDAPPRRRIVRLPPPPPRLTAVPVDVLVEAVRQIVERGHVDWPTLGLELTDFPPAGEGLAARVQIVSAEPGGHAPAEAPAAGDLVVSVDGRRVRSVVDVQRAVLAHRAGQHVSVVVERAGQNRTLDLVATAR